MALNPNACGEAVATALQALTAEQKNDPVIIWQTIMGIIYPDIIANAQVIVTSVTGVSPGGGTSGPGTGTIT